MPKPGALRVLVVVALLHGATHIYWTFLQPLNPELKAFFGLVEDKDVTFFHALYLAVYAVSNLGAGLLAARISPRLLLALSPALNGGAFIALSWVGPDQYAGACVLFALGAMGGGLYHPVANLLLTERFPDSKGRALGWSGVGASLAFIAGPWGASALVHDADWTWQQVTLLYGCYGLLCGGLALAFVPSRHREQRAPEGLAPLRPAGETTYSKLRPILVFALFLVAVMGGRELASWGTTAISAQFTGVTYHDSGMAGFLLAMIFAPGLVVQPVVGAWSDTLGRERVVAAALFVLALGLFATPLAPAHLVVVCYLVMGAAIMATIPTYEALIADRTPVELRGLVFGIVITSGILIGSLGPYLVGAIADAGGREVEAYRHAFFTMAGITGFCACMALGLKPVAAALRLQGTKNGAREAIAPPEPSLTPEA